LIEALQQMFAEGSAISSPSNLEAQLGEMTSRILGGSLNKAMTEDEHPNLEEWVGWERRTTGALQLFSKGWGGEPEYYTPGFTTHLYIPVAMFLSRVMPKHKTRLFSNGKGHTDALAYTRLSREETRMNRCKQWVNSLVDWRQHDGGEYALRSTEERTAIPPWRGFYQANAPVRGRAQNEDAAASDANSFVSGAQTGSDYWT
jgi:hypothetical protein